MSLSGAFGKENEVSLIVDIKLRSPRDGELIKKKKAPNFAKEAVEAGADALSVVTEKNHFNGSIELLEEVNESVDAPIIAKNFFKDRNSILETIEAGADSVLLISSILTNEKLKELQDFCQERDVEPVIETHTKEEIFQANHFGAKVIAINNRDITELEMDSGDVNRTDKLEKHVKNDALIISESSIKSRQDIDLIRTKVDAVVVGTTILTSNKPRKKIKQLKETKKNNVS